MRRSPEHRGPLGGRRVAGAHRARDPGRAQPGRLRARDDRASRLGEVFLDVGAQRLERGDVDDAHFVGERRVERLARQVVESGEEGRERLAGSRRRGDERVAPVADGRPAARLGLGWRAERLGEPVANNRMKP